MDLNAALQFLADQAVNAERPEVVGVSPDRKIVQWSDKTREVINDPPPRRAHRVDDVAGFVAAVDQFSTQDSVVFVSRHGAVLVVDDTTRRDFVRMDVHRTDEFDRLHGLALGGPSVQTAQHFLLALKLTLPEFSPDLRPIVKSLRWERTEKAHEIRNTGDESLGRSVHAKVETDGADIPDEVSCVVAPLAALPDFRVTVWLGFHIDFDARGLMLCPKSGELEAAEQAAVNELVTAIHNGIDEAGHNVPVIPGRFN